MEEMVMKNTKLKSGKWKCWLNVSFLLPVVSPSDDCWSLSRCVRARARCQHVIEFTGELFDCYFCCYFNSFLFPIISPLNWTFFFAVIPIGRFVCFVVFTQLGSSPIGQCRRIVCRLAWHFSHWIECLSIERDENCSNLLFSEDTKLRHTSPRSRHVKISLSIFACKFTFSSAYRHFEFRVELSNVQDTPEDDWR